MNIEQKAKAYDEALERAKQVRKYSSDLAEIKRMEHIFPELAESEDEIIKKELINYLKHRCNSTTLSGEEKACNKWIAWLEKRGEKKSVNLNELTWEDINDLDAIMNEVRSDFRNGIGEKSFGLEVLERFLYNKEYEDLDIKSPKFKEGDEIHSIDGQYEDTVLEVLSDGSYRLKNLGLLSIPENEWELVNAPVNGYELIDKKEQESFLIEKQGEKKSADNLGPKFKVGDWIVYREGIWKIGNIALENYYELLKTNNEVATRSIKEVDENAHLWTIQDAKDGDVLFAENFDNIGGCVFLFNGLDSWKFDAEGDRAVAIGYCCASITESGSTDFGIQGPDCVEIERVHPATKEQRDLLFSKMKESGYEWDAEKKELKLLITNGGDFCESENCEQKPAGRSEEDENRINRLIAYFEDKESFTAEDDIVYANWLKSLKDRVQPKQEWSEEDEVGLCDAMWAIEQARTIAKDENDMGNLWYAERWLKSLKERYTWKPSKEQMTALSEASGIVGMLTPRGTNLQSLYNDLKKLTE